MLKPLKHFYDLCVLHYKQGDLVFNFKTLGDEVTNSKFTSPD